MALIGSNHRLVGCVIACLVYFVTERIISVSVILLRDAGLYFEVRSNFDNIV